MVGYGKKALVVVAAAAAALLAPAGSAGASGPNGDWTQADHDASGNRANTTATQLTAANVGTVDWVRGFAAPAYRPDSFGCGEGWTTPVLTAGRAYAVRSGRLAVLDVATGAQVWQRAIDTTGTSVSRVFAVDSGRVYVGQLDCTSQSDPNGTIRVYAAATGAPLWTATVGALDGIAVTATRVVGTGRSVGNGLSVRVFDAATGALAWERSDDATCTAAPRIAFDRVYYQECDPGTGAVLDLAAARVTDGVVVWRKAGSSAVERGDWPSTGSTHVFTTDGAALDPTNGTTRYVTAGLTRVDAVDTQRVYGACGSVVCAVSKATGARVWTSTVPMGTGARLAVAGALVYTPSGAVLGSATGALVTELWTGPARQLTVGDGYVLVVPAGAPRLLDVYGLPGS